ncbi:MAG: Rrf2 family transcriptional regulator [Corallococcus sp.]|nr:Rrf2 family transcriptional regulator [Corallococcus sp.]MCM1359486.1 Rrf2 family transcriptional regulator [Corallococcus sp.]MCM1394702.1 Rrf2 family transcriptional regulator [Corallococcus sp.]
MKMSSKARYGLYIAVELAKRYNDGEVVSAATLAQATGVTEKYLEQIVALMKKKDIVMAARGANGGYKLSESPDELTVGQILRAVEDNLEIVDCLHKDCANKCNCVSRNLWTKLYENINGYLDTIFLQQLAEDNL